MDDFHIIQILEYKWGYEDIFQKLANFGDRDVKHDHILSVKETVFETD